MLTWLIKVQKINKFFSLLANSGSFTTMFIDYYFFPVKLTNKLQHHTAETVISFLGKLV